MAQYRLVLQHNPEFSKLWLAQVVSLMGDWFNTVVLSTLVAAYTDGSGLALSLFFLARFVPPLLISPFAGVLIDRFNRKHLLILTQVVRALIVPLFLLASGPETLWIIYVVSVVQSAMAGLFEPAQSAILPALLRPDDLVAGNTLMSVTWSAMLALGAAAGGLFAASFGVEAALIFDALTFVFAAVMTAWARYMPVDLPHRYSVAGEATPDTSFAEGLRFVQQYPALLCSILVKGATSLGNVDTLMSVLATQVFVVGTRGELSLSILYTAFGVGAFVGPVVMNRWNDGTVARMGQLIWVGFVCAGVGWFVMGVADSLVLLAAAILVRGVGGSINWTFSSVMIQKQTPDAYLGRMFSLDFAVFQLATILSTVVHGGLIDSTGVAGIRGIVLATGVVTLVPLALWTYALPRLNKTKIVDV
jgi:MFS family permease